MLKEINNIYKNINYNDLNNTSIIISILTIVIFIGLISYYYILINIKPIKNNWRDYRCNPLYMPFAGFINRPDNQSISDYTTLNASYCFSQILQNIINIATKPFEYTEKLIIFSTNSVFFILNELNKLLKQFQQILMELISTVLNKILNILIIFNRQNLSLKDIFSRIVGILVIIFRMINTIWNTIGSVIEILWNYVVEFFDYVLTGEVAALAIAIGMMQSFFLFFPGLAAGVMAMILLVFTLIIAMLIKWIGPTIGFVFENNPLPFPTFYQAPINTFNRLRNCFSKNTMINTINKSLPIKNIQPGDILDNNSLVTCTMILDSSNEDFYILDKTIVTSHHKTLYNNKWIFIKDHPNSISISPINKEPIYCLNTNNKILKINNTIFSDWDDLEDCDLTLLNKKCKNLPETLTYQNIHIYLEPGLHPDTKITLNNGKSISLDKIKLYDKLQENIIVTGLVKIYSKKTNAYIHNIDNKYIIGTANLQYSKNNKLQNLLYKTSQITKSPDYYYHLLTNTGTFYIKNILFYDYNNGIEMYFTPKD